MFQKRHGSPARCPRQYLPQEGTARSSPTVCRSFVNVRDMHRVQADRLNGRANLLQLRQQSYAGVIRGDVPNACQVCGSHAHLHSLANVLGALRVYRLKGDHGACEGGGEAIAQAIRDVISTQVCERSNPKDFHVEQRQIAVPWEMQNVEHLVDKYSNARYSQALRTGLTALCARLIACFATYR